MIYSKESLTRRAYVVSIKARINFHHGILDIVPDVAAWSSGLRWYRHLSWDRWEDKILVYKFCVTATLVALLEFSHESVIEIEEIVESVHVWNRRNIRKNYRELSDGFLK
jgi:hypothetical protein